MIKKDRRSNENTKKMHTAKKKMDKRKGLKDFGLNQRLVHIQGIGIHANLFNMCKLGVGKV